MPLILLPGLGANARMFREQKKVFPQLIVPDWIPPRPNETMAQYAHRFIDIINPGTPFYLGGASFGGIIAYEMAQHVRPEALFLFASGRSHHHMVGWLKKVRSIAHMTHIIPWNAANLVSEMTLMLAGDVLPFRMYALLRHLHHKETPFMKWGLHAILRWKPSDYNQTFPIHHLHGERDPFFPSKKSGACQIIPGAGHLLTKTHHEVVNQFIASHIEGESSCHSQE
ncbi:MAG: alpha/beta hydrolase [Gemmatales bacterium]